MKTFRLPGLLAVFAMLAVFVTLPAHAEDYDTVLDGLGRLQSRLVGPFQRSQCLLGRVQSILAVQHLAVGLGQGLRRRLPGGFILLGGIAFL